MPKAHARRPEAAQGTDDLRRGAGQGAPAEWHGEQSMDLAVEQLAGAVRRFDPQVLWVLLTGTQSYQFVDQFAASGMAAN